MYLFARLYSAAAPSQSVRYSRSMSLRGGESETTRLVALVATCEGDCGIRSSFREKPQSGLSYVRAICLLGSLLSI